MLAGYFDDRLTIANKHRLANARMHKHTRARTHAHTHMVDYWNRTISSEGKQICFPEYDKIADVWFTDFVMEM